MAATKVNKPTVKKYTLKKLKKKIGTGDGGSISSKGLQTVKKTKQ